MNEHAKKIWLAWVNGTDKTQFYSEDHLAWCDIDPSFVYQERQPQSKPDLWRIKPKTTKHTVQYRVWMMSEKGYVSPRVMKVPIGSDGPHEKRIESAIESTESFVCWAGPRQTMEVIVE